MNNQHPDTGSHYSFERPRRLYVANSIGVGLDDGLRCAEHDGSAFVLAPTGTWHQHHGAAPYVAPVRFGLVVPRCRSAALIGYMTAQIAATEGEAARAAFMGLADESFRKALPGLQHITDAGLDCCEAAYRTGGREHTCNRGGRG